MHTTRCARLCRGLLLASVFLSACAQESTVDPSPGTATFPRATADERDAVLAFVNDCSTSISKLDIDARIDADAAVELVVHRDGDDALCGTRDDMPFTTMGELTEVPWLGPTGVANLIRWSVAEGWPHVDDPYVGTFDGVRFTAGEASATLDLVNHSDLATLDAMLDTRAVDSIDRGRPFDDLEELAECWYVGHATLRTLRDEVSGERIR